jgi:hypothetical protein
MKSYRFLARACGSMIKCDLQAQDDQDAQVVFHKKILARDFEVSKEGTTDPKLLLITYEELNANKQ